MPPGRHSSSSHHSSHSHSSFSSSHRSNHSYSSHSSRSYSSYSSGRSSTSRISGIGNNTHGKKTNQPTAYPSHLPGYKPPVHYFYKKHSYTYYNKGWEDKNLGKTYEKGYYDENGNYYKNLVIRQQNSYSTRCECDYCGTQIKLVWDVGALPSCPNCGATLNILEQAAIDQSVGSGGVASDSEPVNRAVAKPRSPKTGLIIGGAIAGSMVLTGLLASVAGQSGSDSNSYTTDSNKYSTNSNIELWGESFYVDAIGREITWNDEYDSYYDSDSDCYVYYNTEQDPNVWQYWYEDVSSDFGDYGWMEYELAEDQWYIETEDGWDKLPSKYDTDKLWHFDIEQAGESYMGLDNTYLFGEELTIDGYEFEWHEMANSYYSEELECYIWYNTDVYPYIWQYYYLSISDSDEYSGCGWMEYDEDEALWYIDDHSTWIVLPDNFDADSLWHMKKEPVYDIHE